MNTDAIDRLFTRLGSKAYREYSQEDFIAEVDTAFSQLASLKERIEDYEKRIAQLVKVNSEHPYHEACPKCLNTKRLLQKRVEKQEKRIHDLESNIIEADAQYNIDKKPGDIESAELALVRFASMGSDALEENITLKQRIHELETNSAKLRSVVNEILDAARENKLVRFEKAITDTLAENYLRPTPPEG